MFKTLWNKVKTVFAGGFIKNTINGAIDSLDKYEDDLAAEIDRRWSSEKIAKTAVDFVQKKLKQIVEKIL